MKRSTSPTFATISPAEIFDPASTTVIANGTTPSGNDVAATTTSMVHPTTYATTVIADPATTTTTWRTTWTASPPSPIGCEPSSGLRPSSRSASRSSTASPIPSPPSRAHRRHKDRRDLVDRPRQRDDNSARPSGNRLPQHGKTPDRADSSKARERKHGPDNTVAIADRPQQCTSLN